MDGLAAASARGRVGGRPSALSQRQLDTAQQMYDSGKHTVEEIAETFHVGRTTLYRQLHAYGAGGACALVVYRNTRACMAVT
nr:helix-turn-helix domain-containing protein [Actinocrispum wychmicini]